MAVWTVLGSATLSRADSLPVSDTLSCQVVSGRDAIALVELYTSEGCSSCPPADAWLSERFGPGGDVDADRSNAIAFHVDYWDQLGWPDRFASPAFSARQRQRAAAFNDGTVYTPQWMLGDEIRVGRSAISSRRLAKRAPAAFEIALAADITAPNSWTVDVSAKSPRAADGQGAALRLALVEDKLESVVTRGENAGKKLQHDRVVRWLSGPLPVGGAQHSIDLPIPTDSKRPNLSLLAWVENALGSPLESIRLDAAQCED